MEPSGRDEGSDRRWSKKSLYGRRAKVTGVEQVTPTGTVRIRHEVIDDGPFDPLPGQFVGIEYEAKGLGYRRSPYCLLPPPDDGAGRSFELLVRQVDDGQISRYLASLHAGDVVTFRAPTGRSMLPKDPGRELVLLATGVGVAPFYYLVRYLLESGFDQPVRLYWGLRLVEDRCLLDELNDLARRFPNFEYQISLSHAPDGWPGLRGRVTESVPPLLATLGGKQFYLCGNGAMVEEMDMALSDMGVAEEFTYKEAYFNRRHKPDPLVMDGIRSRFVADDLFSPWAHQSASLFEVHSTLDRTGTGRNVAPDAASDLFRRVPSTKRPPPP